MARRLYELNLKVLGKPKWNPRPGSRPDPGAVPPVEPTPDGGAVKPDSRKRNRHRRFTQPLTEPERALAKDAERQSRQLKRDHRTVYAADPRR